ncbi:DUF1989 domain-containing protein [Myxosarcina sp. GI1]|uniref:DUF1989 domain-containing protein n=1 Tax=Myxosarcina sp. GI1 TaxID=1541065 RepID=UPI0006923AF0|nr:urea carboxylase-associated family protein [Myxosarcina sp. GI1]
MKTTIEREQYTDLPSALGETIAEYRIPPGKAIAYSVRENQYIQIIDVNGSQCSDWLAFNASYLEEEVDNAVTRTLNQTTVPKVGTHSFFYSQKMQPLAEIVMDTCGYHDSFFLACTSRYYEDLGYFQHPSCSENFDRVLKPYGIAARKGWAAVNFFYNTSVDSKGVIKAEPSQSQPGDCVVLRASCDLLCATSSCADDLSSINGDKLTPIHVRIYQQITSHA